MQKIVLAKKFAAFTSHWEPKIIGELNGQHVKVAKLLGEFVWHHHEEEDELFLVLKGTLVIEFRDDCVELGPGEMLIVPRMVEHRPVAKEEVEVLLFEPVTTRNTGQLQNEWTVNKLEEI